MSTNLPKTDRIHALDSLRAIMMLLGVVLHSALTYNVTVHGEAWNLKDLNSTNELTDLLVLIIHSFRMPIFFMIAGFFGALLFYERGMTKMLKNRISRIAYPFIIFLMLLWPIVIYVFNFTAFIFNNEANDLTNTLLFNQISDFIPQSTFHLWFLYTLFQITIVSILLGIIFKKLPKTSSQITNIFNGIIQKPLLRILFFAGLTFLLLAVLGKSMVEASVSLIPDLNTFIFYFFFYLVGWIFYKSKQLLQNLTNNAWTYTFIGIGLLLFQAIMSQSAHSQIWIPNGDSTIAMAMNSIIVWLFTFGISGLFIKYQQAHSSRMRYISDASYWVYLIHLPITALLPAFILNWPISGILKFLLVTIITSIICFVSYHYLVRSTFIGKFLNGRKYPK